MKEELLPILVTVAILGAIYILLRILNKRARKRRSDRRFNWRKKR